MNKGRKTTSHGVNRQSTRLSNFDYSQSGMYFVTICVQNKECLLGTITNDDMIYTPEGEIAFISWKWLEDHFSSVTIDSFCIMPNHTHAIIQIHGRGALQSAPTEGAKSLGQLIGAYKTHSTVKINKIRKTPGIKFWQRNFYDHIIRDEKSLNRIREYIESNPLKWALDQENPDLEPPS